MATDEGCYTDEGYADLGYFTCDTNTNVSSSIEGPRFKESLKENYRGAPGVKINHKTQQKTPNKYEFVTSIVIESEKGEPNVPTYINTAKELINTYGEYITKDMQYALSFLLYSPSLLVSRAIGENSFNSSTKDHTKIRVDTFEQFEEIPEDEFLATETVRFITQTPGAAGNLLKVSLFTTEELERNAVIYQNFQAKDIISGMDSMCYCVAIFQDDLSYNPELTQLKEVFVIPFNDLESINYQSDLVYVRLNAYNNFLDNIYDGNEVKFSGNLVFADGSTSKEYYGYDGNLELIDGMIGFWDGNEFNDITYIVKYYGDNIMPLVTGVSGVATPADIADSAEGMDNKLNYDIDLHIGNNITLSRDDVINIVGTPKGLLQAIDFKSIFPSTIVNNNNDKFSDNIFYIYGTKPIEKTEMNCSADYAGLRSKDILTNGLGRSTSKISTPFAITRLKTNPSQQDVNTLYQNGINVVQRSRGIVFCNGEIIHEENI